MSLKKDYDETKYLVLFGLEKYDVIYDIGIKRLRLSFDKLDGFIRDYGRTKYLVSFGLEKHDAIYDRIGYLVGLKSGIKYVFSYNCVKK